MDKITNLLRSGLGNYQYFIGKNAKRPPELLSSGQESP